MLQGFEIIYYDPRLLYVYSYQGSSYDYNESYLIFSHTVGEIGRRVIIITYTFNVYSMSTMQLALLYGSI